MGVWNDKPLWKTACDVMNLNIHPTYFPLLGIHLHEMNENICMSRKQFVQVCLKIRKKTKCPIEWILLSNTKKLSTDTLDMGKSQKFSVEKEARDKTTYCMIQEYAELIYNDKN